MDLEKYIFWLTLMMDWKDSAQCFWFQDSHMSINSKGPAKILQQEPERHQHHSHLTLKLYHF